MAVEFNQLHLDQGKLGTHYVSFDKKGEAHWSKRWSGPLGFLDTLGKVIRWVFRYKRSPELEKLSNKVMELLEQPTVLEKKEQRAQLFTLAKGLCGKIRKLEKGAPIRQAEKVEKAIAALEKKGLTPVFTSGKDGVYVDVKKGSAAGVSFEDKLFADKVAAQFQKPEPKKTPPKPKKKTPPKKKDRGNAGGAGGAGSAEAKAKEEDQARLAKANELFKTASSQTLTESFKAVTCDPNRDLFTHERFPAMGDTPAVNWVRQTQELSQLISKGRWDRLVNLNCGPFDASPADFDFEVTATADGYKITCRAPDVEGEVIRSEELLVSWKAGASLVTEQELKELVDQAATKQEAALKKVADAKAEAERKAKAAAQQKIREFQLLGMKLKASRSKESAKPKELYFEEREGGAFFLGRKKNGIEVAVEEQSAPALAKAIATVLNSLKKKKTPAITVDTKGMVRCGKVEMDLVRLLGKGRSAKKAVRGAFSLILSS